MVHSYQENLPDHRILKICGGGSGEGERGCIEMGTRVLLVWPLSATKENMINTLYITNTCWQPQDITRLLLHMKIKESLLRI